MERVTSLHFFIDSNYVLWPVTHFVGFCCALGSHPAVLRACFWLCGRVFGRASGTIWDVGNQTQSAPCKTNAFSSVLWLQVLSFFLLLECPLPRLSHLWLLEASYVACWPFGTLPSFLSTSLLDGHSAQHGSESLLPSLFQAWVSLTETPWFLLAENSI